MGGALQELVGLSSIFGRELFPLESMSLVRVISDGRIPDQIATPVLLSSVKPKTHVARRREYLRPQHVDQLDARFSDDEFGSELYLRAKSALFDLEAVKPGTTRKVILDGEAVEISDYRPWLSHWLIRGLADLSSEDERLREAGIAPGRDLESRLVYREGLDFSG